MPTKIGYAVNATTYGEFRKSQDWKARALGAIGDFLDRFLRAKGAPLFPKDAPLHQPNCGVVAMCMFTDIDYATTVAIFARTRRPGWIGGTYKHEYAPCAAELGFSDTVVQEGAHRKTLGQLAKETEGKPGRIFATVDGHAVCVWDGLIFDQNFPAGALPAEHFSAAQKVLYTMRRA